MTTLSRCLAAVATSTCFLASPCVVYAGELDGSDPAAERAEATEADEPAESTETTEADATDDGASDAAAPAPTLQLEAPRLEYGTQGPSRGDGRNTRLGNAGVALTVLGGVSLVGSTFWLMVCPADPEVAVVGQGMFEDEYTIKCFDAEKTVTDRFRQANGATGKDAQVTLKAGAGNPVLPGLITMAAAGGVMLGTGIALLVINNKRNKQGVAAVPMMNGSTAGMMVSGKF